MIIGRTHRILLLILVFAFLFGLRLIHLGADPPADLSISMGYYGDPGGYAANARNKVVFGTWILDEWNFMHVSPLPHYLNTVLFRLFGTGIAQMNAVPALFSCGLLFLFFLTLRRIMPFLPALAGVFLLGLNYPFLMFSRIGVRAVEMVFFCVLALWILTDRRVPDTVRLALAGAAAFLAFTVKGTFLLVFPAIILGTASYVFFQSGKSVGKTLTSLVVFGSGMAALAAAWFFLLFLPNKEMFLAFGTENYGWLAPTRLQTALANFWHRPLFYFQSSPVTTSLAGLGFLAVAFRWLTAPKKVTLVEGAAAVWLMSNIVYFSIIYYRPARHFIPLIAAMAFLAVFFLRDIYGRETLQKPRKAPLLFFFPLFGWIVYAVSTVVIIRGRPLSLEDMQARIVMTAAVAVLASLLVLLALKIWPAKWAVSLSRPVRTAAVVLLVLASTAADGRAYLKWALAPPYDMRTISRDFEAAFDHMVLGGLLAPVISLETRHRAHAYYTDYINKGLDFLDKYGITHVFLTTYAVEKIYFENDFPEAMAKARLLARYPLWRTHVELFELDPSPLPERPPDERLYEGEIFFGENGLPRFDPEASGRMAFRIDAGRNGGLCRLPDIPLPPGEYSALFTMKIEDAAEDGDSLGRIDILDPRSRRSIAGQSIEGGDFPAPGVYRVLALDFSVRRPSNLVFRVIGSGRTSLWFDKVVVRSLE